MKRAAPPLVLTPAASCAIFTPTLAPMRVAPASTSLRASSRPLTPPDAFHAEVSPDRAAHQGDISHRGAAF